MPTRTRHRTRRAAPPTRFQRSVALIKRNKRKSVMYVLVFLGALVPAWKGVEWIDQMTDDWQLARHAFVYGQVGVVDKKVLAVGLNNTSVMRDIQTDLNNLARRAAKADMRKWKDELDKTTLDQTQREDAQQRYNEAKNTYDALAAQSTTIKDKKASGK